MTELDPDVCPGRIEELGRVPELMKRIKKTARTRFRAHERLIWHHRLSQWTLALISTSLIALSMALGFGFDLNIDHNKVQFLQTALAMSLLVYSLLLGHERFLLRAHMMHTHAGELRALAREVRCFDENCTDTDYKDLCTRYNIVLDGVENHAPGDYLFTEAHYAAKEGNAWRKMFKYSVGYLSRMVIFSHYVFFILAGVAIITWCLVSVIR